MTQLLELFNPLVGTSSAQSPKQSIDAAINRIFGGTEEETRLQRTRSIMGDTLTTVTDEDLEIFLTEFQYLIDGWIDAFEIQAFDGMTLKQLLGQA